MLENIFVFQYQQTPYNTTLHAAADKDSIPIACFFQFKAQMRHTHTHTHPHCPTTTSFREGQEAMLGFRRQPLREHYLD